MTDDVFDLGAYLGRIGYTGPTDPTLTTLAGIVAAHSATIPFENFAALTGETPKLDIASLQAKLVGNKRGGYCYEHSLLLRAALRAMGFQADGRLGRVIRGLPFDAPRVLTHMALVVTLPEGSFLADVGFGNSTPTVPLRLEADTEQTTSHETFRFAQADKDWVLQIQLAGAWENVYRLSSQSTMDIDFDVANWFVSTHPASIFTNNLVAARPGPNGIRYTFLNGRANTRYPDGRVDRRAFANSAEIVAALSETFGLDVDRTMVDAAIAALERRGTLGADHPFLR